MTDRFADDPPLSPPRADMNLMRPELIIEPLDEAFKTAPGLGIDVRDLGLGALSGGRIAGQVFRASRPRTPLPGRWHMHDLEFQVGYITSGWGLYEYEGLGRRKLSAGTCICHPPRSRQRMLDCSDDFEGVWFKSSTIDRITGFAFEPETGTYREASFVAQLG